MRPDLIGEGYSAALAELQDNVPPFDTDTAYGIIESELGAPVSALFSRITPQPIASASLGQVGPAGWAGWGGWRMSGRMCEVGGVKNEAAATAADAYGVRLPANRTAPT